MKDTTPIRRRMTDASDDEVASLADEIRSALEGPSNDAEHDALVAVAEFIGIEWVPDAWEIEEVIAEMRREDTDFLTVENVRQRPGARFADPDDVRTLLVRAGIPVNDTERSSDE